MENGLRVAVYIIPYLNANSTFFFFFLYFMLLDQMIEDQILDHTSRHPDKFQHEAYLS